MGARRPDEDRQRRAHSRRPADASIHERARTGGARYPAAIGDRLPGRAAARARRQPCRTTIASSCCRRPRRRACRSRRRRRRVLQRPPFPQPTTDDDDDQPSIVQPPRGPLFPTFQRRNREPAPGRQRRRRRAPFRRNCRRSRQSAAIDSRERTPARDQRRFRVRPADRPRRHAATRHGRPAAGAAWSDPARATGTARRLRDN